MLWQTAFYDLEIESFCLMATLCLPANISFTAHFYVVCWSQFALHRTCLIYFTPGDGIQVILGYVNYKS